MPDTHRPDDGSSRKAGKAAGGIRPPFFLRPSVRGVCEHMFVRWDSLSTDADAARRLPGYRDEARRPHVRRARGARHPLLRGPAKSRAQPRAEAVADAVPLDDQPVPGLHHACVYCFARPTHTYLDFNAGRDFEREIVVKVNVPEVLRAELARPSWKREHVALGTNTDPYQWVEGRYKLMPRHLGGAARRREPVLGPDQVAAAAARPRPAAARSPSAAEFSANLSVPTLDEKAWRATEPHTPHPRARLEAVAELNRAGHPDRRPDRAADARASTTRPSRSSRSSSSRRRPAPTHIGGIALHLRGEVRDIFFDWLRAHRPDLVAALRGALRARRVRAAGGAPGGCRRWCARTARRRGADGAAARPLSRQRGGRAARPSRSAAAGARRRCSERAGAALCTGAR